MNKEKKENTCENILTEKKKRNSEVQKEYYQRNKEKRKEYNKAYFERNREKMKEYNKAYYERNREKRKEYSKAYYERNREAKKEYRQRNKDIYTCKICNLEYPGFEMRQNNTICYLCIEEENHGKR